MAIKKFMMIYRALLLLFCIVVLVSISAFSHKKLESIPHGILEIEMVNNENYQLINQDEIERIYKTHVSNQANEININVLEDKINQHPLVKKSEVFSSLNGNVYIKVFQKTPIARLIHQKPHMYLDENGGKFPLSSHHSVEVPLVNGVLKDSILGLIAMKISELEKDEFFKDFFAEFYVEKNGKLILFPADYQHTILLGTMANFSKKIENLKSFYQVAGSEEQLKNLKYINVQYKDQVICGKRN